MRLTLNLNDDPTWAELIAFVDLARGHVSDLDSVEIDGPDMSVDVRPENGMTRPAVIPAGEAAHYAEILEAVLNREGDARGSGDVLTNLCDALRTPL